MTDEEQRRIQVAAGQAASRLPAMRPAAAVRIACILAGAPAAEEAGTDRPDVAGDSAA